MEAGAQCPHLYPEIQGNRFGIHSSEHQLLNERAIFWHQFGQEALQMVTFCHYFSWIALCQIADAIEPIEYFLLLMALSGF